MKEMELRMWLLSHGYADITIKHTIGYLKLIEKYGLDLDSIESMEEILKFFGKMREKGKTTTTLNYYVRALNRYIRFRGLDFKLQYYKQPTPDMIWIPTDEEVRRILSVRWARYDINLRNRAILQLFFATGIRLGELVALNWSDFDEGKSLLTIRTEKRAGVMRYVPVPPKVKNLLLEYKKVRIVSDVNAFFTTPSGRISKPYTRKIVKEAGTRAGVPKFHAHAARHWRAVKWLEEGVSLESIRRLLGHATLKSTQIYWRARPIQSVFEEVVKKDSFWWGTRKKSQSRADNKEGGDKNEQNEE
ncbi:MAG: site-specific integrase [Euryarchaeota archaeon]|nr:site-specific integrase [Euryarchaeota archaeon]